MNDGVIENLSNQIAKLPGMGPRIAKRIVLRLALNKEKLLNPLILLLQKLHDNVHSCVVCGNLDEGEFCRICLDQNRIKSIICVVENIADLWAIERIKDFKGLYHVLGGSLSAYDSRGIAEIRINELIDRAKNPEIKEIIIATSPTIDGQTTANFIAENLKNFPVKITRLTYGIPIGGDFDYLDEGTISIAMKTRSEI